MEKDTTQTNSSFTHATAECEAYELQVDLFDIDNLLPNFVKGVVQSAKTGNWDMFIDQFGTHFVYEVIFGGRATQQTSYSYEAVSTLRSLGVDLHTAAKARYAFFYGDASYDWKKYQESMNYSMKMSSS